VLSAGSLTLLITARLVHTGQGIWLGLGALALALVAASVVVGVLAYGTRSLAALSRYGGETSAPGGEGPGPGPGSTP
jgi:hypothetical protein